MVRTDSNESSNGSFSALFKKEEDRKNIMDRKNMLGTFVGTPLYTAPEMLE